VRAAWVEDQSSRVKVDLELSRQVVFRLSGIEAADIGWGGEIGA
jgi:hypothetical protein